MDNNILFVSHEYSVNGSTKSMISLAKCFYKAGIRADILVPRKRDAHRLLDKLGIKHICGLYFNDYMTIKNKWNFTKVCHEIWNYLYVYKLALLIKKGHYDYVISNSTAVDVAARACLLTKTKHVYYVREFMEEDFSFEYRCKRRMKKLLEKSDKVIFISKAIQEKYINKYNINNYIQIYNGITPDDYYQPNHIILEDDTLKFVQVGSISDGKGVMNTLELISLVKNVTKCHLTLVGRGNREYLEKVSSYLKELNIENIVDIVPFSNSVRGILNQNDILIMNSRLEGFGRVTVEGMMNGLLVMGRASGGTKEIISDEVTGILFNDNDEFIKKIKKVLNDKEKYKKIALQGQDYALMKFTPEKCAENVIGYIFN